MEQVYSAKPFLILRLRTLLWELTLLKNISSLHCEQIHDRRIAFHLGDAQSLPVEPAAYDAVVSGFVLNFVPQPKSSVKCDDQSCALRWNGWQHMCGTMRAICNSFGTFGTLLVALDRTISVLDEGRRFPLCRQEPLSQLFRNAQLEKVRVWPIDVATTFSDFDDYWSPFLGGQGPAPAYTMSLSEEKRVALREYVRKKLPISSRWFDPSHRPCLGHSRCT